MGDAARGIVFDDENLTVSEYLDRWLSDAVRGTVRESTFSRDKYLATNHIKPSIGRIKLKNLNALHLQGLYRERMDSGLSGSTVQKVHHVIHKALAQAVRWSLIPAAPPMMSRPPHLRRRRCSRYRRTKLVGCSTQHEAVGSKPSTYSPSIQV
jgi:integrase